MGFSEPVQSKPRLEKLRPPGEGCAPPPPGPPTAVIAPPTRWESLALGELWQYRELLFFFVWRDIKVRYKQTLFGAAWAVIQPVFTMLVFSVFFGRLAGVPSDGLPYPIFAYAALVPWTYFANSITTAGNSLVDQERIISKVYFPRLLMPLASILAGLVDFTIAFAVLLGLIAWYGISITWAVLTLPLFILLAALAALAVGLWLAALNVQFRDVRYAIPFIVQFWLFATPVAYSSSLVPERWRILYGLNPMAGVVEGFRWALLGQGSPPEPMLGVSVLTVLVILVSGLYFFRRLEQSFVDVV
jgi:lipopolysaccharide transport system permease protein